MNLAEFIRRKCDLEDPETHGALARVSELEEVLGEIFNNHNEPDGAPDGSYQSCKCNACEMFWKIQSKPSEVV